MSFGFGVGDILVVAKLCNKLHQDFADAPHQLREIGHELRGLQIELRDVESYVSTHKLDEQISKDLSPTLHACNSILKDVAQLVDRNCELLRGSKGRKLTRVWRRLKWDPKEIQNFRARIIIHATTLASFNDRISRDNTTKLMDYMEEEDLRKTLNWLCPDDYGSHQADYLAIRQPGTGQWLINSPEFKTWLEIPGSTLFCPGMPGAGKTIITSIVIDYLSKNVKQDGSVGLAYVYLNSYRDEEQNLQDVFSSLLRQLVSQQPQLARVLAKLHRSNPDEYENPLLGHIIEWLLLVLGNDAFSRIFIVIDALDESPTAGNFRGHLLSILLSLPRRRSCNLFATSRFISQIEAEFDIGGAARFEIRATRQDVGAYVATAVGSLNDCVRRNTALQEEITEVISDAVDGMFLLARLFVYLLDDSLTVKAVRTTLEYIRKRRRESENADQEKLELLHEAYSRTMERIWKQRPGRRSLAERTLTWVITTRHPLTTLALQHSLAIEDDGTNLDKDNIPDINDIMSVCAGLVIQDKERDIIRLVHYTAQEYLDSCQEQLFPQAHWKVAKTCLACSSFPITCGLVFTEFSDPENAYDTRHSPFFEYAECNWAMHLRASEPINQMNHIVIEHLKSRSRTLPPSCELKSAPISTFLAQSFLNPWSGEGWPILHQALFYGLYELAKEITRDDPEAVNRPDARGATPLHAAACHHDLLPMGNLLRHGCTEIRRLTEDSDHQYPLRDEGRESASLLIAHGAFIDHSEPSGRTPLLRALMNEDVDLVRLLLENGADPSLGGVFAHGYHGPLTVLPPLHYAATVGSASMVRLLLNHSPGIVESRDGRGGTAMLLACALGHKQAVQVFIEFGANMNLPSTDSITPLMAAIREGHVDVFKLLVKHNGGIPAKKG